MAKTAIRRATPSDLDLLMAFVRDFHAAEHLPTETWTTGALQALLQDMDHSRGIVLIAGGDAPRGYLVLGFGYSLEFSGRDAFVDEVYVVPAHRRGGIGKKLLAAAEEECLRLGIKALHLEVDHANPDARRLYESHGYKSHPRHLMTKWLAQP